MGLVEGEFIVAKLTQITLIPIRKWTESFELWWKETRNLDKIKNKILFANEQQSLIYSCVNILGSGGAYMRQSTGSSWVPFMAFRSIDADLFPESMPLMCQLDHIPPGLISYFVWMNCCFAWPNFFGISGLLFCPGGLIFPPGWIIIMLGWVTHISAQVEW